MRSIPNKFGNNGTNKRKRTVLENCSRNLPTKLRVCTGETQDGVEFFLSPKGTKRHRIPTLSGAKKRGRLPDPTDANLEAKRKRHMRIPRRNEGAACESRGETKAPHAMRRKRGSASLALTPPPRAVCNGCYLSVAALGS